MTVRKQFDNLMVLVFTDGRDLTNLLPQLSSTSDPVCSLSVSRYGMVVNSVSTLLIRRTYQLLRAFHRSMNLLKTKIISHMIF